jgi:tetratricopeptide (TPR) repeat protein
MMTAFHRMSSNSAVVHGAPAASEPCAPTSNRRVFYLLAFFALVYAFFAGLRTVSDFDLGWQMATGRWIVQHHSIPSVDVLSFTAAGQPWIYPVAAGIIFYSAYLLGGFALISWIGAAACVGAVALLLRKNTAVGSALAILSVPIIALRTTPRADMFTVVLFAAFLSILWEQHRYGDARLWFLPLLMIAWVNLHLGFVAGIALIAAYIVVELLDVAVNKPGREAAWQRLRCAVPWLACAVVVTLLNPWGWGIYRAILIQQRVNSQHEYLIAEWSRLPLTWLAIFNSLSLRQATGALYMLLAVAIIGAVVAITRTQLGAALLLLGASYVASHYVRMGALFACTVVVVAGPLLSEALTSVVSQMRSPRVRSLIAPVAVALLAMLVAVRCFDLATNRFYLRGSSESTFGAGLGWWFPQRAAGFIEQQDLPGEVFSSYNVGGYLSWRLGPQRRDTIDGRAIVFGVPAIQHNSKLLQSSPDSPLWQQEASRYGINTILLPLGRFDAIELVRLLEFCNSTSWLPVYLDEVSAVFVRRDAPGAVDLTQRFPLSCANAPLPSQRAPASGAEAFNQWSNAAAVLAALGRNPEALTATDNALAVFPDSSFAHWLRGNLLAVMNRSDEALEEYRAAISLEPSDVTWSALSDLYRNHGRTAEAIDAMRRAAALSARPYTLQSNLGYLYLKANLPKDALRAFDTAERTAPARVAAADSGTFDFMLAQGRSVAYNQLGDLSSAIAFQEKATKIEPYVPEPWRRLAKLYRSEGRLDDALRADLTASAAEQKHSE